jgi:hypothetical protein
MYATVTMDSRGSRPTIILIIKVQSAEKSLQLKYINKYIGTSILASFSVCLFLSPFPSFSLTHTHTHTHTHTQTHTHTTHKHTEYQIII